MVLLIRSLLSAFLPIFMLYHQFRCDAKPSKLQVRAKRDFMPSAGNSAHPCGCVSKYAPINCRCTIASGNSEELLCRCDRALVSSTNREDSSGSSSVSNRGRSGPMMAQCGGNCRMPAGEPNLFRHGGHQQHQHGHGNYGYGGGGSGAVPPIHSACHPICHKSCTHSCTSSRSAPTSIDQSNNFGGGGFSPTEFHQQHNQPSMDSKSSTVGNSNCFPSQCRANCLRACARIFDAQQRQQIRENFVSNIGNENENDIVVEPHYQVEMGGQTKSSPEDHGNNQNNNNMMPMGRNGGCQCSPTPTTNVCECQESCYPICVDTCESNCLQQQMQQTPANQRSHCAQFCHLECQHDCAVEQQQQQQRVPARKAVENAMVEGIENNNNWAPNGNPIAICAHKCPRACEHACQSAAQNGEPQSNCVPTCIGLCAQSCARGIQFDAVGLIQQMAVPMPAMASVDLSAGGGTAQMPTNISTNFNNAGGEYEQLQKQQKMNDWGGGVEMAAPNFGQNDGSLAEYGNEPPPQSLITNTAEAVLHPLAMEDAGRQEQAVLAAGTASTAVQLPAGEATGAIPCAPLCQPECRPECTKRYTEEQHGIDDRTHQQQYGRPMVVVVNSNGINNDVQENGGGKSGGEGQQQSIGIDQQQSQNDQQQKQQQRTKQQRSAATASSSAASFVPPHIILDDSVTATAFNDDEYWPNVTTKGQNNGNDNNWQQKQQQLDKMSWLRMQNATDTFRDNNNSSSKNGSAEFRHLQRQQQQNKTNKHGEMREQQEQKAKIQSAGQRQQKVANAAKGEKRTVVGAQNGHHQAKHKHHHHAKQLLNKDGKIGRRANEFFRRRKVPLGGELKMPTKKVPKNGKETMEKIDTLKAVKQQKIKAQNATTKNGI